MPDENLRSQHCQPLIYSTIYYKKISLSLTLSLIYIILYIIFFFSQNIKVLEELKISEDIKQTVKDMVICFFFQLF